MNKTAFKSVGLMGHRLSPAIIETFMTLLQFLHAQHIDTAVETAIAKHLPIKTKSLARAKLAKTVDLIIVVGGDGSLLQAAKYAVTAQKPIVGINRGRLGFLTDIKPDALEEKLGKILAGEYQEESRFLLEAHVKEQRKSPCVALNDVVLAAGDMGHMIEFEVYVNDRFVCSERSDGMIISTPTGSTAYALSGGGPIIDPQMDAILLLPMFSHTLTNRPIVIPGNNQITLVIGHKDFNLPPRISADGEKFFELKSEQHIVIQKKQAMLRLLHPADYDYFENVRSKLYWGKKLQLSEHDD